MTKLSALDALIPHAAPTEPVARTLLVAIRRLATGGLNDAHASNLLISNFGMHYRRPLLFLRIFLEEISRISRRQIAIAPCCCPRMTAGEVAFLEVVARARVEPDTARATISRIAGTLDCLPAISVAQALADALDDIGHPLIFTNIEQCRG